MAEEAMETNAADEEATPEVVEAKKTPEVVEAKKTPKVVEAEKTPDAVMESAPQVLKAPVVQKIRTSLFNAPFAPPGE